VALSVDGKPLPEDEGPVRLLIPGEGTGHYHRWLFGIATITVLDGAKLAPTRSSRREASPGPLSAEQGAYHGT
jgi:hypothetical protein